MDKLFYVGFSFPQHGEHAGYDQIKKYISYDKIIDCQKDFDRLNAFVSKQTFLSKAYYKVFSYKMWWVELQLIFISLFHRKNIHFHIIYGENIYRFLGFFKLRNHITLTLHQPISFYKSQSQKYLKTTLRHVDNIIVMSNEMHIYFRNILPGKKIKYIPHGIDTNYFKPKPQKQTQILMVGNWLRDFVFASTVFSKIQLESPNTSIKVVTNPANHTHFQNNNVECLSSISDDELLELYQSSKVVFLPLIEFTANNAILEACSCGCKVIVSSTKKNILQYNSSTVQFIENDLEIVSKTIIKSLTSWDITIEENNRKFIIDNYDWKNIGEETKQFLFNQSDT